MSLLECGPYTEPLFRREIKYLVKRHEIEDIRSIFRTNFQPLWYNNETSLVHSIYFDTFDFDLARASINGVAKRCKIRLRWYDSPLPKEEVFLEHKRRDSETTGKSRQKLKLNKSLNEMTYDDLLCELRDSLEASSYIQQISQAVTLVSYEREHYQSTNLPMRLTLDYDISCVAQGMTVKTEFPQELPELAVVEVKVPADFTGNIEEQLQPLSLHRSRCSKYLRSLSLLGLP